MKKTIVLAVMLVAGFILTSSSFAEIKYVGPYVRSDGTCVSGSFRDTSHDGNPYNNANYLGYNN